MKRLLVISGLIAACGAGALSVDLSNCQYAKATGDSERLQSAAGTVEIAKTELIPGKALVREATFPAFEKAASAELQVDFSPAPLHVKLEFPDKAGKEARPPMQRVLKSPGKHKIQFMFVPGTAGVKITLNASEKLTLNSASLVQADQAQWVSTRLFPAAFTDNIFAVESNGVTPMAFVFKNIRKERPKPLYVVIDLPAGFQFVASGNVLEQVGKTPLPNGGMRYKFLDKLHGYQTYTPQHCGPLQISTTLPPGPGRYPMTYFLEYANYKTIPYTSELIVLPEVKKVVQPKRFKTGFISGNELTFHNSDGGAERIMKFLADHGFNCGQIHPTRTIQDAAKRNKIERYWSDWWFVNGFSLGKAPKPDNVIFRNQQGKSTYHTPWHDGLCPVEAYTYGPYFRDHVIGYIEERIFKSDLGDQVIANWEPLAYDSTGCFCDRCRDEFAKYSKLPPEVMRADWPKNIVTKHRDQWIRFRSLQHAKVVKAIRKGFGELEKKYNRKLYFVPEVAWSNLFEQKKMYEQYDLLDYLDQLRWVNPWGPYIFQQFNRPFIAKPGVNLGTYIAAREMKKRVAKFIPDETRRPKLLAFPHGVQCFTWMTTPEALAYETLAFFVNGWEGSMAYLFPHGSDARYFKAMAKANRAISCYEDFTFDGTRSNDATMTIETPVPGPAHVDSSDNPTLGELSREITESGMVTLDCYQYKSQLLVALGNAWQKGAAFVRVKIPRLPANKKYAVYSLDRNVVFGRNLNAEALAEGLLFEVPALGWSFMVIAPENGSVVPGQSVSQSEITAKMRRLLPELKKSAATDLELIKEANETVLYNFGATPSLQAGTVSVKPLGELTSSILSIQSPAYTAELDMGKGGGVRSLKSKEKVLADAASGGIMRDGFWSPADAVVLNTHPYRFVGWEATKDGAVVTLEGRITAKQSAKLRHFTINKRYLFGEHSIRLDITVINESKNTVTTAYRLHNMPESFTAGTQSILGDVKINRPYKATLYNNVEAPLKAVPWNAAIAGSFKGRTISFPGMTLDVTAGKNFSGVFLWDGKTMKAPSAELFFAPETYRPGQKQHYSFSVKLK